MKRPGVGVAIGRFQVHDLHDGHVALINRANEHQKLVVFICVSPHLVTPSDPLDYPAREQMVRERFPGAITAALPDQPTDEGWSEHVDKWLGSTCPTDSATIYFGRDSSIKHYSGRARTSEIDEVPRVSGTDLRAEVGKTVEGSRAWRAGVIYAAHNMWPRATACVDVCVISNPGTPHVLVASRLNERGLVRFPGGHVNISDETAEAAARRELREETGIEASDYEIVGNYRVKGWKNSPGYVLFTTLFVATATFGAPQAADDIDHLRWVPLSELLGLRFADSHEMLARELFAHLATKGIDR